MDMETFVRITEGALQMGVGALIASVSTWYILRNQQHEVQLPSRETRRMQVLEEISAQVTHIGHTFTKYSTLVQESLHFGGRWPAIRYRELEVVSRELSSELQVLSDAQDKLRLLGEKNLARILRVYCASMIAYTRQVCHTGSEDAPQQIRQLKPAIQQAREHFYDVLSRKYERLLADA